MYQIIIRDGIFPWGCFKGNPAKCLQDINHNHRNLRNRQDQLDEAVELLGDLLDQQLRSKTPQLLTQDHHMSPGLRLRLAKALAHWELLLMGPRNVGNSLAELDVEQMPAHLKREGQDWYVVFNPAIRRVLDVDLVHTLPHCKRRVLCPFQS